MCELLGLTSLQRINVNTYLREFYSHSFRHCHGWGQALFRGASVSMEKEAVCANQSLYLRQRLAHPIAVDNMIAHIRLASVGRMFYENCHPFSAQDTTCAIYHPTPYCSPHSHCRQQPGGNPSLFANSYLSNRGIQCTKGASKQQNTPTRTTVMNTKTSTLQGCKIHAPSPILQLSFYKQLIYSLLKQSTPPLLFF